MASAPEKYEMAVYPMTVAVRSASDGAKVHQVHLAFCDCADFTNRKGRLTVDGNVTICKHIAQAMALVGGWNRPGTPEVHVDVHQAEALDLLTADGNMTRAYAHSCLSEVSVRLAKISQFDGNTRSGIVTCDHRLGTYTVIFTS